MTFYIVMIVVNWNAFLIAMAGKKFGVGDCARK